MRSRFEKIAWKKREISPGNSNHLYKLRDIHTNQIYIKKVLEEKKPHKDCPQLILGSPKSAVKEWNQINPNLKAEIHESGWIALYIEGIDSTPQQIRVKQIALFNGKTRDKKRRHILDLYVKGNAKTPTGESDAIIVDMGQVLCFDEGVDSISLQYWQLSKKAHDAELKRLIKKNDAAQKISGLFSISDSQKIAKVTAALLYLQFAYPEIKKADFLEVNDALIATLADAYVDKKIVKFDNEEIQLDFFLHAILNYKN
ncbi:MAG: hypothetical protein NTZ67_03540 [Gammaproteobacteria bacterium]|nr:hypothetical protein [Gammaproteobacteria bacterium]